MTKVTVTKKGGKIVALHCDGHTGYGVEGEDIVCAALSSVVQTAVLGLMGVAGINARVKRGDGMLSLELPENLSDEARHDADTILETMLLGVADLYEGYSDFIELEVK
ncbi:MAG: ribosomal-processing cysteine protease Prp [Clostridiales bacterium]|nr:ribosomal-processing cysteine protease Prp [Clostridiales bacterium]